MIVMRTPKGWTGPKIVDGKKVEGTHRSHQVPLSELKSKPEHLKQLEEWMRSYKPQELFEKDGSLKKHLRDLAPDGDRRMGSNPHANGGKLLRDLKLPDFEKYAVEVKKPGVTEAESTGVMGKYLRDVMKLNEEQANFRIFRPG